MSTKDEIVKNNLAFVYGRSVDESVHDPDKRSFIKSRPKPKQSDIINSFTDDFDFLSPFYSCSVCLYDDFVPYPTYEHALQASKLVDENLRKEIKGIESIKDVKSFVNKHCNDLTIWKTKCSLIAEELLLDKFIRNKSIRTKLTQTNSKVLIYLNNINDNIWGVSDKDNKGQNKLGRLLEQVRTDIENGNDLNKWISLKFKLESNNKIKLSVNVCKDKEIIHDDCKSFNKSQILIGKDESNDIIALHPSISRVHAILLVEKSKGLSLIDLNSAYKTKVNNQTLEPFQPLPITFDSIVKFGGSNREYTFDLDLNVHMQIYKQIQTTINEPIKQNDENTVFISNLSYQITENQLRNLLNSCGKITSINIPIDKHTQLARGIAFVTFHDIEAVSKALFKDGDEFMDRKIRIKRHNQDKKSDKREINNSDQTINKRIRTQSK
mmetsp:Transcript_7827/g.6993  ORF Transcript_7827/g.6993 Transcript_7827/m.6993 type:complete len:438 (+) Transcript_7827:50-1363(+)